MGGPTDPSKRTRLVRIALVVLTLPALLLAGSAAIGTGDGSGGGGSSDGPWTAIAGIPSNRSARAAQSFIRPQAYQALTLDQAALEAQLASVPDESAAVASRAGTVLSLPSPSGELVDFRVVESPVMEPGLAVKFPDIRTYRGQGIDDPAATLRFDVSDQGFHAQVLSPGGAWYIDPYFHLDTSVYISYFKRDLTPNPNDFVEGVADDLDTALDPAAAAPVDDGADDDVSANRSGTQLRVHRAAIAATGEYTAFQGGTVAGAQAAIVTAINRVNGIYEVEVAIRLVLVADNDDLVYTNAATDPYTNNAIPTNADLAANQTNIDAVIGNADYDIGHVVTTGRGGRASLNVVGVTGRKARGTSGTPSPNNDAFAVDILAHEVGHQYGANHTFNGALGNCNAANRSGTTAYEPGAGSTIMAYVRSCGLDNLQTVGTGTNGAKDPYFHSVSFDEIVAHTTGGNPGDIGATSTGNTVPTAAAGADGAIPASTPFLLQGAGTDADADTVTYDWEQRDLGQQRALNNPEITAGPLFRSVVPTTSPIRYLPRLSTIAANNTNVPGPCPALTGTIGAAQACWSEFIPTAARAMNFRVTVRDNRAGGGGVNTDDSVVTVADTGAPFAVTSQSSAVTYGRGSSQNVTWNVAGTTAAPISAPNVNILLSTDGGLSFPTTLLANTANDGSQAVTLPNVNTTTARIMVVESGTGVGVRFFNVNTANFTIAPAATTTTVTSSVNPSGFGLPVTFTATVSPSQPNVNVPSGTVQFSVDGVDLGTPVTLVAGVASSLPIASLLPGTHTVLAVYSGDANFLGGSGGLQQVVACTTNITGDQNGSLLVGPGSVCIVDATISGSVQTRTGTALFISQSTIDGSIGANRNVAFAMCASDVSGSVLISRTQGSVLVGDGGDNGTFACPGNTIGATLSISRTTGSAEASGNTIGGSLSLTDTVSTGAPPGDVPKIQANSIDANLGCLRNAPPPVDAGLPNTIGGARSGQCRLL